MESLTLISVSAVLALLVCQVFRLREKRSHLPPGPPALPIIGNVHQIPLERPEQTFFEWGRRYGDIIYACLFHRHTVIINSVQVARDLLEKRSANYSDRPPLLLLQELIGWRDTTVPMRYGERFRKHRRWVHDALAGRSNLESFQPLQLRETYIFLTGLLESPEKFIVHAHRHVASVIANIAYGHNITGVDDDYLLLAEKATADTVEAGNPASNIVSLLVDFFPILQYYPLWLPGSGWKAKLLETRRIVDRLRDMPFDAVKEKMAAGIAPPSFVTDLLEELTRTNALTTQEEVEIKGAASGMYAAGTDTQVAVLTTFLLNMVRQPEIYQKAQEEIDRVIGHDRLPDFNDRESLPYLKCIMKETYRWTAPVALSIPHASVKSDEYEGYYIPGNATIIPNIWGMCHNEQVYPDPEQFSPERYLDGKISEGDDPINIVFGFGRRSCPGRYLADSTFYLIASNLIATMDVCKAKDTDGREIMPSAELVSGLVRHPRPFAFTIRPRSQRAVKLIVQMNASL